MVQYKYGQRKSDGKVLDIDEIPVDLTLRKSEEWICVCPLCQSPFVAAKGKVNADHFRHKGTQCRVNDVHQTALHMRAKEIIKEEKLFYLPAYTISRKDVSLPDIPDYLLKRLPKKYIYQRAKWLRCNSVELEKRISNIVPDVVAYTPEGEYLIEIFVTNPVTPAKIAKAEKIGLPLLEVMLGDLKDETVSLEQLREIIIESNDRTEWRYFPDREKALAKAQEYYDNHWRVRQYRFLMEKEAERRAKEQAEAKKREEERKKKLEEERKQQEEERKKRLEEAQAKKKEQDPGEGLKRPTPPPLTLAEITSRNKDFFRNMPVYDGNPHRPRRKFLCIHCKKTWYKDEMMNVRMKINEKFYENIGTCIDCGKKRSGIY